MSETDADTIEAFLDARANDSASFDFPNNHLPGETASNFNLFVKIGINLYPTTIELLLKLLLDKFLNQLHNDS